MLRTKSSQLSIVDSTDVKAKVDTLKIKDDSDASPDKDACYGYKSEKKPFFGYKAHANPLGRREIVEAALNRLLHLSFALVKNQDLLSIAAVSASDRLGGV